MSVATRKDEGKQGVASSPAPTLRDVAKLAGVSPSTASRVLNGSSRIVAMRLALRVEQAATSLNYSPNSAAQATARGASSSIALLIGDLSQPYFGAIAAGVAQAAAEAGSHLILGTTGTTRHQRAAQLSALRAQRPCVVLLAEQTSPDDLLPPAASPVGTYLRTIEVDNYGGSRSLARMLIRRGYESGTVISPSTPNEAEAARLAGFADGLISAGKAAPSVHYHDIGSGQTERVVQHLLSSTSYGRQTVVLALTEDLVTEVMASIERSGRRVGTDLAVAGFSDRDVLGPDTFRFTRVRLPLFRSGYVAAASALVNAMTTPTVHAEILLRQSTPDRRQR